MVNSISLVNNRVLGSQIRGGKVYVSSSRSLQYRSLMQQNKKLDLLTTRQRKAILVKTKRELRIKGLDPEYRGELMYQRALALIHTKNGDKEAFELLRKAKILMQSSDNLHQIKIPEFLVTLLHAAKQDRASELRQAEALERMEKLRCEILELQKDYNVVFSKDFEKIFLSFNKVVEAHGGLTTGFFLA